MRGQKGFIIQQIDFALLKIKNELFISRAGKDTCVCSTINPRELFMFSFFFLSSTSELSYRLSFSFKNYLGQYLLGDSLYQRNRLMLDF